MSNALRRKKKKSKQELEHEYMEKRKTEEKLLLHMRDRLNVICLWSAYCTLGFKQKRILRMVDCINQMIIAFEHKVLTPEVLITNIEKYYGLNMFEKCKEVTLRQKMKLFDLDPEEHVRDFEYIQMLTDGSFESMFDMVIYTLHKTFRVSKADINKFIEFCFEHIRRIYDGHFTADDLREQLLVEIGLKKEEKPDDKS